MINPAAIRSAYSIGMIGKRIYFSCMTANKRNKTSDLSFRFIDLRAWILKNLLGYSDKRIFENLLGTDGWLPVGERIAKRRQYIASKFGKTVCPNCEGFGYVKNEFH